MGKHSRCLVRDALACMHMDHDDHDDDPSLVGVLYGSHGLVVGPHERRTPRPRTLGEFMRRPPGGAPRRATSGARGRVHS